MLTKLIMRWLLAFFQLNECTRHLSPILIRFCNDSCDAHLRVIMQHGFYFKARNVLSSRNDDVFNPVTDFKISIWMNYSYIPCMEPIIAKGF